MGYFSNKEDEKKYEEKLQNLKIDELKIVAHQKDKNQILPLDKYDILLLPYQDLGPTLDTPLLILEGLSSNCKIITSNIEPLNYINGNIFFVDNFSNSSAFVKKIEEVWNKKNIANTTDYSTTTFGNAYLNSLKEIGLNV
jgi:glycosyltransferase involved in cell wall biosynthesis